jgi:hypothetical protein
MLDSFIRRGRLTQIPAQHKKWQIILEKLAQECEPDREYTEREVNQILVAFHDDVATLQRDLVDQGLMGRKEGSTGGTLVDPMPDVDRRCALSRKRTPRNLDLHPGDSESMAKHNHLQCPRARSVSG